MNKKKLGLIGVSALLLASITSFTACAGEDGADGVNGTDGKDGVSCTAKKLKDESGYTLTCDGEVVGTITNGENGEDGISCTATEHADGSGIEISCDGEVVGTITNGENGLDGENGTSCTAEKLANGSGFDLVCDGKKVGMILNGQNGKMAYSLALMASNTGKLREYVFNNGKLEEGSVTDGKGTGSFKTWDGSYASSSGIYQVQTGEDDGSGTSGWFFDFSDATSDGGTSTIVFPAAKVNDGAMDAIVDACGGVCGSMNFGEGYDYPFVGIGFNIAGGNKLGTMEALSKADISDWNGLCLAYTAGGSEDIVIKVEVAPINEQTVTEFDAHHVVLPVNNGGIVNIPWGEFAQEGWGTAVDIDEILKSATQIKFTFHASAGDAGYFNISKVGMYGQCGETFKLASPEQYTFVPGTDILTKVSIPASERGTGVETWDYTKSSALVMEGDTNWWYYFTDAGDDNGAGTTAIDFPAALIDWDGDGVATGLDNVISVCKGFCGTVKFGAWQDGLTRSYKHYADVGFDTKQADGSARDIRSWKGICLTYTAVGSDYIRVFVKTKNDDLLTGYDSPMKMIPTTTSPMTINILWDEFAQEGWGSSVDLQDILVGSGKIHLDFTGDEGESAQFNIMQFGAYGNCN